MKLQNQVESSTSHDAERQIEIVLSSLPARLLFELADTMRLITEDHDQDTEKEGSKQAHPKVNLDT